MSQLMSVDIETTGLDPRRHEAWEIAIIPVDEHDGDEPEIDRVRHHFYMPVTLVGAELKALAIGDFEKRYDPPEQGTAKELINYPKDWALSAAIKAMHEKLKGNHLMGCSVHFDAAFLSELFRKAGLHPQPWHHRVLDLGSFAGGWWGFDHPWSHSKIAERVPNPHEHTAFGDAEWNVKVWEKIREEKLETKV